MPLLVRDLHKRDAKNIRKELCMRIAHHEAGHIAPLHRPGAGADTHRIDAFPRNIGKQPAGKLRQAFDMRKYRIGLTQAQLPLLYGQKLRAVHPRSSVKPSN